MFSPLFLNAGISECRSSIKMHCVKNHHSLCVLNSLLCSCIFNNSLCECINLLIHPVHINQITYFDLAQDRIVVYILLNKTFSLHRLTTVLFDFIVLVSLHVLVETKRIQRHPRFVFIKTNVNVLTSFCF